MAKSAYFKNELKMGKSKKKANNTMKATRI